MKFHSLRTKLLLSVCTLVIGSGLAISVLVTNRLGSSWHQATITQGEYLAQAVALEATNKILINDLMALQNLLNHQLKSNPSVAYLFIVKDGQILAHTFSDGFPMDLLGLNSIKDHGEGNFKRIVTDSGDYYHDIVWPIFSGKAGMLRIGISEKSYKSELTKLWLQMLAFTLGILVAAIGASYVFIRRITRPLSVLAEAAEGINEDNLDLNVKPESHDEVGRLTASIKQMIGRIRDYTRRIEQNALELQRAQRQTRGSFEIIQQIWNRDNINDVSAYLIAKFQEIMACQELVLFLFSHSQQRLLVFCNNQIKPYDRET